MQNRVEFFHVKWGPNMEAIRPDVCGATAPEVGTFSILYVAALVMTALQWLGAKVGRFVSCCYPRQFHGERMWTGLYMFESQQASYQF